MSVELVAYPPSGRLLVPAHGARGAAAGATVLMACRPVVVAAHHGAWAALRVLGPRVLPGERIGLESAEPLGELLAPLRAALGPFDGAAVLTRRQALRPALLALVLRDGRPRAFVKAVPTSTDAGLRREQAALHALAGARGPGGIVVPRVIAAGSDRGWSWLASTPMPARPHRPAGQRTPVEEIASWLHGALADAVPRDDTVPSHWSAMHGDFAPWNVRRYLGGPLALVDFEEAALAPPAADVTYWHAARAALRDAQPAVPLDDEARGYWLGVVEARLARGVDPTLDQRLVNALRGSRANA